MRPSDDVTIGVRKKKKLRMTLGFVVWARSSGLESWNVRCQWAVWQVIAVCLHRIWRSGQTGPGWREHIWESAVDSGVGSGLRTGWLRLNLDPPLSSCATTGQYIRWEGQYLLYRGILRIQGPSAQVNAQHVSYYLHHHLCEHGR